MLGNKKWGGKEYQTGMSQTMILNDPIVAHCYHAQTNKCITSSIPANSIIHCD